MQIKLIKKNDDLNILHVSGKIEPHELAVLKAGILKLLRDGKNRILLDFTDEVEGIDDAFVRETALLNFSAHELAGEIAVSTRNVKIEAKFKSFSSPPPLKVFSSQDEAFKPIAESREQGDSDSLKDRLTHLENILKERLLAHRIPVHPDGCAEQTGVLEKKLEEALNKT